MEIGREKNKEVNNSQLLVLGGLRKKRERKKGHAGIEEWEKK